MERPKVLPSELVRKGWCHHETRKYHPGTTVVTARCLVAAAQDAIGNIDDALSRFLYRAGQRVPISSLATWNDTSGRTQAEVVALLESVERDLGWLPGKVEAT
jgi:hypothetical protein